MRLPKRGVLVHDEGFVKRSARGELISCFRFLLL